MGGCSGRPRRHAQRIGLRPRLARRPQAAFGPELAATVLARRPYDLRHAALSLWLNASGAPAEVAAGQQLPSAELRGQGPQMDYFAAPTSRYAVGCRAAWFLREGHR